MNEKGFTLIEFLVAMSTMLILLTMTAINFQNISYKVKQDGALEQSRGDSMSTEELLRLDLEHAGTGIASQYMAGGTATDNKIPPVLWDNTNNKLIIHSTMSNTKQDTMGIALGKCEANQINIINDLRSNTSQSSIVLSADLVYDSSITTASSSSCEEGKTYIILPYNNDDDECDGSGNQPCTQIEYRLSSTQNNEQCASQTRNIIRGASTPVFNCVADFQVRYNWDEDEDGVLESSEINVVPGSETDTQKVRTRLKNVFVYILAQIGKKDERYTFSGGTIETSTTANNGNISFTVDGQNIDFSTNFKTTAEQEAFKNYHWKVIKINALLRGF